MTPSEGARPGSALQGAAFVFFLAFGLYLWTLPPTLAPLKGKVWGLSIQPDRLHRIRSERRPDSKYASVENCRYEVAAAEKLMRHAGIPYLDSTTKSIEEIATTMLHEAKLVRRVY